MKTYYIGADVHCNSTELAIENKKQIIKRYSVPTTIRAIIEVLDKIEGHKHLVFEEGPMAGWLYRNLKDHVSRIVVCDPRRNHILTQDGTDKTDPVDAAKLARLLRGKFLRPVYHTDDNRRLELKRWVGMYHSRVKDAVSQINKLRAQGRLYGMRLPARTMRNPEYRLKWLNSLDNQDLALRLELLWTGLDTVRLQVRKAKHRMIKLAKKYSIIDYWSDIPGIGPIRSITLYAYLDTPFRFSSKSRLWKYCGLGLIRQASGTDKNGKDKPGKLRMNWYCNKQLKNVVISAAISAIRHKDNAFRKYYEDKLTEGMKQSNARHATARKMLTVLWGMWKSNSRFDAALV